MKLILGLGNPGQEYEKTRHNIGFIFLDYISNRLNIKIENKCYKGLFANTIINGEKVIFLKPQTFMNNSGQAIEKIVNFYKLSPDDILVIHDDIDLDLARVKVVKNSSSGGHNGIKSIESCLGTKNYMRIKLGINSKLNRETKNFVLGKFTDEEMIVIKDTFKQLNEVVEDFINLDYPKMTSKYNNKEKSNG